MTEKTTLIVWVEPFGPNGEPVECRVTPETAIAVQKYYVSSTESGKKGFKYATDRNALDDFMTTNWAWEIEESK